MPLLGAGGTPMKMVQIFERVLNSWRAQIPPWATPAAIRATEKGRALTLALGTGRRSLGPRRRNQPVARRVNWGIGLP